MTEPSRRDVRGSTDELQLLERFLDFHRDAVVRKVRDLDREAATRSLVESPTTLLGIVKHLSDVEGFWFSEVLAGEPLEYAWSDDDPDGDWRIGDDDTVEGVVAAYERACARSRDLVAGRSPLDLAASAKKPLTLRWIMVHMIEETARHAGHADILRELVDGSVGE